MAGRFDIRVLAAVAVLLAAVAAGAMLGRPPASEEPALQQLVPSIGLETGELIVIHVSGAVVSAGLVEVAESARVADVIAAAGGVTADADMTGINLAAPVSDGQQVVIPFESAGVQKSNGMAGDSRVRVNQADAAALEALPGVGPVLAGHLVAHREAYGPFQTIEDLLDVPGIGEQKLAALRDHVIVP